jgi:hypothetical protein
VTYSIALVAVFALELLDGDSVPLHRVVDRGNPAVPGNGFGDEEAAECECSGDLHDAGVLLSGVR